MCCQKFSRPVSARTSSGRCVVPKATVQMPSELTSGNSCQDFLKVVQMLFVTGGKQADRHVNCVCFVYVVRTEIATWWGS